MSMSMKDNFMNLGLKSGNVKKYLEGQAYLCHFTIYAGKNGQCSLIFRPRMYSAMLLKFNFIETDYTHSGYVGYSWPNLKNVNME